MSALGAGGHGYFAIDITNIKSPKQLFAIENKVVPSILIVKKFGIALRE